MRRIRYAQRLSLITQRQARNNRCLCRITPYGNRCVGKSKSTHENGLMGGPL